MTPHEKKVNHNIGYWKLNLEQKYLEHLFKSPWYLKKGDFVFIATKFYKIEAPE